MKKETKFKQTEIGQIPEDWEYGDCFVKAVENFVDNEKFLLVNDLNERTISHKLAEYLQKYFQDHYNVDCEYNKMLKNDKYKPKRLHLDNYIQKISTDDDKGKTVFPDIVIHTRGSDRHNFVVIEIKKKSNSSLKEKKFDFLKLKTFTTELKYELGIYLEFDKKKVSELKFFKDGNEL
jgi:hypothetical protein